MGDRQRERERIRKRDVEELESENEKCGERGEERVKGKRGGRETGLGDGWMEEKQEKGASGVVSC